MQKLIFAFFLSIAILFLFPITPGSQTTSSKSQEIDVQGKTDQQIISIFQNLVPQLEPSELEVAKIIQAEVETEKRATDKAWDEVYSQRFQAVFAAYRKMDDQKFIAANIEKELSQVESELASLEKKIEMAQTYIDSKETGKQSFRDRMKADLANLPLEIVMIGIAEYPSTIIEQDAVKAAIARAKEQAVERINGVFIQSQSLIAGGVLVEDIIKAVVGSKVEVRESLRQNYTRVGTPEIVHTIQRYAVFPLQKDISGSAPTADSRIKTQAIVLDANNVASLNDYPEEIVKQGNSMVEAAQSFNRNQQERISAVVIEAQASLDRLERDIRSTLQQIKTYETDKIEFTNRQQRIFTELTVAKNLLQPLQVAYEQANEQLKKHLASRQVIHIDFKSAEKDPTIPRNDQYQKLIRQCVIDFRDKVQTSYLQTITEVRNFMLVDDQNMKIDVKSDIKAVQIIYLSYRQTGARPSYGVALKFKARLDAPQNSFGDYQPKMIVQQPPPKELEFVFVPGGTFLMGDRYDRGSCIEQPIHRVTLSDFYMGKTEVTNAQYATFLNYYGKDKDDQGNTMIYEHVEGMKKIGNRWQPQSGSENHPVTPMTWYGAAQYAKWAGGRLPTEAEWEYAAREGGKKDEWRLSSEDSNPQKPNALGLFNMLGGPWELCNDWFEEDYYKDSPEYNPKGPYNGVFRVLRGGFIGSVEKTHRISYRIGIDPNVLYGAGFRVVKDSPQ